MKHGGSRLLGLGLAAGAVVVVLGLLAASGGAKVVVDPITHHRFGIVSPQVSPAAGRSGGLSAAASPLACLASFGGCSPLQYNGGPVQHGENDYLVFWAPTTYSNPFPSAFESGMKTYVDELAGDDYTPDTPISVDQQYYDLSGAGGVRSFVPYALRDATIIDTDAYPTSGCPVAMGYDVCLTDGQIESELSNYISAHSLPTGINTEYFVLTPQGVGSCFDSAGATCDPSGYCGYHTVSFPSPSTQIVYADIPWAYQAGCDINSTLGTPYPNSGEFDSTVSILTHELSETMTDPDVNAWMDSSGYEIGDRCSYVYGSGGLESMDGLSTDSNGGYYNLQLGSDFYLVQMMFDNRGTNCALTDTDTQPTASLSLPGQVYVGEPTTFSLSNVTDPAGIAYVTWSFGDGGASTSAGTSPAEYTYAGGPGNEILTAVVTDNDGNELELTKSVAVTLPPPPSVVSAPTVSGTATQGQTLTEAHGSWLNGPTSYGYEWEDCDASGDSCSAIAGATNPAYTLRAGDVGHTVRVTETARNAGGSGSSASAPAGVVIALLPTSSGLPSISGTTTEGQTLTEAHATWSNDPTGFTYRWETCGAPGTACTSITMATSQSYTLSAADVGHTIRVIETASNSGGAANPATSAPTAVVQPSSSTLTAALSAVLGSVGRHSTISRVLARGGFTLTFRPPGPGTLAIVWREASEPTVVVARGSATVPASGSAKVKLTLTRKGRSLLRRVKRLKVLVTATVAPAGGRAMSITRKLTLKR